MVTGIAPGTAVIGYTVANANGCAAAVSKTITVNNLPVVTEITGMSSVCAGSATLLVCKTAGGTWRSAATGIATVDNSGLVTAESLGLSLKVRYFLKD